MQCNSNQFSECPVLTETKKAMIDQSAVREAMSIKWEQLREYRSTLSDRDDEIGKHARAIADGRLLQLEQDMALIALQPVT